MYCLLLPCIGRSCWFSVRMYSIPHTRKLELKRTELGLLEFEFHHMSGIWWCGFFFFFKLWLKENANQVFFLGKSSKLCEIGWKMLNGYFQDFPSNRFSVWLICGLLGLDRPAAFSILALYRRSVPLWHYTYGHYPIAQWNSALLSSLLQNEAGFLRELLWIRLNLIFRPDGYNSLTMIPPPPCFTVDMVLSGCQTVLGFYQLLILCPPTKVRIHICCLFRALCLY